MSKKTALPTEDPSFVGRFTQNLFGAIAGGLGVTDYVRPGIDRIPLDGSGKTLNISGKGQQALWMGLRSPMMQKKAYEFCYPVASVCDRLAEADTTGCLEIIKTKGKGKEAEAKGPWATEMGKLFAQPNPMQTWEQFRGQQIVYKKVFGYCPVLPIARTGFENNPELGGFSAIINVPPWCFEPISSGKFLQSSTVGLIKEYRVNILGKAFTLRSDQIFILTDSFLQDESKGFLVPMSRLVGLDMAVSNICAAMEADNIMLRRSGPMGIFTPGGKDGTGSLISLDEDEKKEAQEDLSGYGISWSQFQYMISRNPLTLQTIGFNAKQLGSKETILAGEKAICKRYNYSYVLYEDSGATYANQSGAHKALYQNNVIPNAMKDMGEYNKFFKSEAQGCVIIINFDNLPILQENDKEKADAAEVRNGTYQVLYDNNLVTKNDWLVAQGLEPLGPDGDKYKSDKENPDPLAVRLGVGGTQALVDLLANTGLDEESKVNALQILFGLTPEEAKKLVPKPVENEPTQGQGAETTPQPGANAGNQAAGQGQAAGTGAAAGSQEGT